MQEGENDGDGDGGELTATSLADFWREEDHEGHVDRVGEW